MRFFSKAVHGEVVDLHMGSDPLHDHHFPEPRLRTDAVRSLPTMRHHRIMYQPCYYVSRADDCMLVLATEAGNHGVYFCSTVLLSCLRRAPCPEAGLATVRGS